MLSSNKPPERTNSTPHNTFSLSFVPCISCNSSDYLSLPAAKQINLQPNNPKCNQVNHPSNERCASRQLAPLHKQELPMKRTHEPRPTLLLLFVRLAAHTQHGNKGCVSSVHFQRCPFRSPLATHKSSATAAEQCHAHPAQTRVEHCPATTTFLFEKESPGLGKTMAFYTPSSWPPNNNTQDTPWLYFTAMACVPSKSSCLARQ